MEIYGNIKIQMERNSLLKLTNMLNSGVIRMRFCAIEILKNHSDRFLI